MADLPELLRQGHWIIRLFSVWLVSEQCHQIWRICREDCPACIENPNA